MSYIRWVSDISFTKARWDTPIVKVTDATFNKARRYCYGWWMAVRAVFMGCCPN